MARRRRPPRPGGRPRGKRRRPKRRPQNIAPVVPDTAVAKLEEETRLEVARLMKALLSEGGFIEEERTLARIVEQHPEHAAAFMEAEKHFSSGDADSPFVHIGLHLIVERGVVSRDHEQLSRQSSDKSWHDAVHERAEAVARELFPEPDSALSEEAS
jgi:hypothetical protein